MRILKKSNPGSEQRWSNFGSEQRWSNAHPHTYQAMVRWLQSPNYEILQHPFYYPNISPDYHLLKHFELVIRNKTFLNR